MDRNTFETALTFGEWPYTLARQALRAALADVVELFSGPVAELAGYLERSGARRFTWTAASSSRDFFGPV